MFLKFVYTLFIGVLFAALVGFGIAAFYEAPKEPEYPTELKLPIKDEGVSGEFYEELKYKQQQYDKDFQAFMDRMETYNRNVSIISIIASVIIMVIALTLFKKILLIADGLLLGGVLTLIYSIIRGIASGNDKFRFVMIATGLLVALILGYVKFIAPKDQKGQINE